MKQYAQRNLKTICIIFFSQDGLQKISADIEDVVQKLHKIYNELN